MREQANIVDDAFDKLTNTTRRNTRDFVVSQLSIVFQVFRSVSAKIGNRQPHKAPALSRGLHLLLSQPCTGTENDQT